MSKSSREADRRVVVEQLRVPDVAARDLLALVQGLRNFFAAFSSGKVDDIVNAFHPRAKLVAVREGSPKPGALYGTYSGHEGVRTFLAAFSETYEPSAFDVESVVGEGAVAFASGTLAYRVTATGRPFLSAWALRCIMEEGRILSYRFFEDSAALLEASR